jgi:hypothetical protein
MRVLLSIQSPSRLKSDSIELDMCMAPVLWAEGPHGNWDPDSILIHLYGIPTRLHLNVINKEKKRKVE